MTKSNLFLLVALGVTTFFLSKYKSDYEYVKGWAKGFDFALNMEGNDEKD